METLKVGKLTLTWLNGGVTHLDGGAMFGVVPKPLWSKKYPFNEKNQIELRTDPILIQNGDKNILIEAGIGNNRMSEKLKRNFGVLEESSIEQSLQQLGLTTKDIDLVLMTHMHFDHVCGLTKWVDDKLVPTFENATIFVSQTEWDEMREPNIRSQNTYWKENRESIQENVQTFKTDHEVIEGIKMIHTGGHSDGHAIVTIESEGEKVIHMADLLPTHAHQNALWVMAYDDYPMQSITSKKHYMDIGLNDQVWFTFYHDAIYRAIKWNSNGEVIDQIDRKK
ncbi:glyoxylase-like metal-dependent hydrolase (beta-lactamase superfamily II) [Bacillus mesophilus]|uniref:MBL fold metallo-hydrolase n=1 Tax=Bacillus mesophilus TaxID=1808955 RepID=A0A6M0Q6K9_9BACI|nr:glyoxylase-like metal-dependent hydrolase (beta-lactamase superfamily II) [Bacillus mesophilus]NEY71964.1 MBL fold metallo-hydrolase [Bacillus mesophilus]